MTYCSKQIYLYTTSKLTLDHTNKHKLTTSITQHQTYNNTHTQQHNPTLTHTPTHKHTHTHTHTHTDVDDDTADILKELDGLESEYYTLAIHLHLSPGKVKTIQKDNPHSSQDALGQGIAEWLKMNYEHSKFGKPSWRMLVEAVSTVDLEQAKTIASNHRKVSCQLASFHFHIDFQLSVDIKRTKIIANNR